MMDDTAKALLRRVGCVRHRVLESSLNRTGQEDHLSIELSLIPEVIIDGGHIYAGPFGDGTDGGTFKPFLGKHLAGGIEDFFAGTFLAGFSAYLVTIFSYHNASFKHLFDNVKQMFQM